jgi:hypothetical protein
MMVAILCGVTVAHFRKLPLPMVSVCRTLCRFKIACMLNYLWQQRSHRAAFETIALDSERFIGFANGTSSGWLQHCLCWQ